MHSPPSVGPRHRPFRSKSKSPARIGPPPSKTYALIRSSSFLPWVGLPSPLVGRHPAKFEILTCRPWQRGPCSPQGPSRRGPNRRRFSSAPIPRANLTITIRDNSKVLCKTWQPYRLSLRFRSFRHLRCLSTPLCLAFLDAAEQGRW